MKQLMYLAGIYAAIFKESFRVIYAGKTALIWRIMCSSYMFCTNTKHANTFVQAPAMYSILAYSCTFGGRYSHLFFILLLFFFFLNCFWWNRSPFCLYSPLSPLRGQPTGKCHPRWQPIKAGEIAGFEPRSAVLQSGVATNEPPLLPVIPIWFFCENRLRMASRELLYKHAFSRSRVCSYSYTFTVNVNMFNNFKYSICMYDMLSSYFVRMYSFPTAGQRVLLFTRKKGNML